MLSPFCGGFHGLLDDFNGFPHQPRLNFLKVLEFLYTDTASDVSLETAILLLIASEQFMLDRLKALCEDLIRRDIHVDNVISILVASHRHHASGLKDIALEFILKNLKERAVMSGLDELKAEPDLLLEIIRRRTQNDADANATDAASGPLAEWNSRR